MYGRGGHPIEYWEHAGGWTAGHILVVVLLALLAAAALVFLVRLLTVRRPAGPGRLAAAGAGVGTSAAEALGIARLRYARGEIGRDDFARMSADLGAPLPGPVAAPPAASEAPTVAEAPAVAEEPPAASDPPDEPAPPQS